MSCDQPLFKDKTVINEKLLDTYIGQPCYICESTASHAGHRIRRSNLRLDVPENIEPTCDYHNDMLANSTKERCIRELSIYFDDPEAAYNYLTDADGSLYKKLVEKTLQNEPKKRTYRKFNTSTKTRKKWPVSTGRRQAYKSPSQLLKSAHKVYAGDMSYSAFISSLKGA